MDRVLVAGSTGAGKTTLARALSASYGMPHYELDGLHHGPGWVKRPEFEADVERFSEQSRWVTEDQYHRVLGDLLWHRADTVVWLDVPRRVVMSRVIRRSFIRALTRRELWNGNREHWRDWLKADHPIQWAWTQYHGKRAQVLRYAEQHPDVTVIRVATAHDVRRLLTTIPRA
ncbi:adenylate kinase [Kibdelosporangium philippinense]|uniref:Adenylate kinase n=1 Tax=Kibdelosporangium philippinense TaxID=211113 RepID=A0ABS8Z363_9PSEU|nr:adenylate kinase [Kibdelosporangium philippinense]MCE7002369.1 adenylate kinase [Kibdelosporangium philippinense]